MSEGDYWLPTAIFGKSGGRALSRNLENRRMGREGASLRIS
jgi:hypothetical protein